MVTMKTIAAACGVARSTVSYALNDRYVDGINIPEETRQRIKTTAAKYGYFCNEIAKAVTTQKSNIIGFYAPSLRHEYISRTLEGVFAAAQKNGYFVKLFSAEPNENATISKIIGQRPAGIIAWTPTTGLLDGLRESSKRYGIPVMLLGSFPQNNWAKGVTSDDAAGSALAVNYLLEKGHSNILHLAGPQNLAFAKERCKGFCAAMRKTGHPCGKENIIESPYPDFNETCGEQEMARLLKKKFMTNKPPTAIYCASDFLAMQSIRILSDIGFNVPDDVSVIGYGNLVMAKYANPSLTTIAQPFERIGQVAFDELLETTKSGKISNEAITVDVELIKRQSVATIAHNLQTESDNHKMFENRHK